MQGPKGSYVARTDQIFDHAGFFVPTTVSLLSQNCTIIVNLVLYS